MSNGDRYTNKFEIQGEEASEPSGACVWPLLCVGVIVGYFLAVYVVVPLVTRYMDWRVG